MKIGVLAVQGAFAEHIALITALASEYKDVTCVEVRQKGELAGVDGLVLPGGESTVQGRLIRELGLIDELQALIEGGTPVLATCAGLILLAETIEGEAESHIGTLPVTVRRNAYGRQLGSFVERGDVGTIEDFPLVFIRAPYVAEVGSGVSVLAEVDSRVVGVEFGNQIGLAFHPEMTSDTRVHRRFLDKVSAAMEVRDRR